MKKWLSGQKWHRWIGVALSLPCFIVGFTAVMISLESSYKDKASEPKLNVSWLPGYSESSMRKEKEKNYKEIKSSLLVGSTNYFGTKSGLFRLERDKLEAVKGLEGSEVFALEGTDSVFYAGTKMGLYRVEGEKVSQLNDFEAHHIDLRDNGTIAISTNKEMYESKDNGATWKKNKEYEKALKNFKFYETGKSEKMGAIPLHKFVMDLHTGKAFFGKSYEGIWIFLVGLSICFLTLTGIYMWYKSVRKKKSLQKAANS